MKIISKKGKVYKYDNYHYVGFVIKNRELYRFLKKSAKLQNRTISNCLVNLLYKNFIGDV